MGIKRRQRTPEEIEAFGAAAEAPVEASAAKPAAAGSTVKERRAGEWPDEVARTMLIRWPDPALAIELNAVAKMDDRSQHATALRALQRGLEILKSELKS